MAGALRGEAVLLCILLHLFHDSSDGYKIHLNHRERTG